MPASLQQARARLLQLDLPGTVDLGIDEDGVKVEMRDPRLHYRHSFVSGNLPRRARQSPQALLKACQNRQRSIDRVLDLTAGWGADALTLACHGRRVTLLEHNPLLFAIVDYARASMAANATTAEIAQRIEIENAGARAYLESMPASRFECIYLDPMFPPHKSGAKPGKEMQILQRLTENAEIETCFELALNRAGNRVVVKRPLREPRLGAGEPDIVYREKTIRFDVYLT